MVKISNKWGHQIRVYIQKFPKKLKQLIKKIYDFIFNKMYFRKYKRNLNFFEKEN